MVSPFERFPRQTRGALPPEDIATEDDDVIRREASRIRQQERLNQIAQRVGGPGTRVADPNLFQQFLQSAGEQYRQINEVAARNVRDPIVRQLQQGAPNFGPEPRPDAGLVERFLPGFSKLATPNIPEGFVTNAPTSLQPAARVVREVSSPLGLATLPLGGSARVVAGGLAGAMGGATAGQTIGGDTGELIGAIGGGIAGGIPAVQRLAGRGATRLAQSSAELAEGAGRGVVRAGDEAALRLQGRQVAHASTGVPPEGDILRRIGQNLRNFSQNRAEGRRFLRQNLEPLFLRQFGDAPVMNIDVPLTGQREVLVRLSTGGWRERAEQLGLQHVGTSGFDDLYRLPSLPNTPAALPRARGALPQGQVAHAATGGERLSKEATEAAFTRTRAAEAGQPPPAGAAGVGTPDDPVPRLVAAIQNVKRLSPQLRAELAEKRRLDLGTRVGVGMGRAADVAPSRKAGALRSALSGEMSRIPALEPVRGQFSPDDIESLYGRIWNSSLRDLEKGNAADALTRVLLPEGLDVPTPSEMTLLERVFGPDMRRALEDISKGQGRKAWEAAVDALNISRALKSSWDISAMFRQGAILSISHPNKAFRGKDSATVRMLRAFRSPEAHQESLARITSDPDFDLIAGAGRKNPLFIADAAETKITAREEAFMSRWASRIPGIKGSQRAFNTYLNEMKWKTAKSYVEGLRSQHVDVTPDSQGLDTMTRFLNVATGRGKLGFLERRELLQEMATVAFWSPRLTVSRFQVPIEGLRALGSITPEIRLGGTRVLGTADPALRAASRQIAGDLVKYTGSVLSFLTFLKLSGLAEVEVDPRSSDFGKIRVGGIRVDAWAGFQPVMRYTAQFITGESKPITTGGIRGVPRDEVFGRFLRSKLSPGAVGLGATFIPEDTPLSGLTGGGRTFIGERIVPGTAKPYKTVRDRTVGLDDELLGEFVIPLIYKDITEAIRAEGLIPGAIFGAAPLVGFGVTTIPEEQARSVPTGALR